MRPSDWQRRWPTFAAPEPLPWTDFYVARGRALAAWGRGEREEPEGRN